jgi:alpha-L-arabinofuranosidase
LASWNAKSRRVFINALNRSSSQDVTADIDFCGLRPAGTGGVWQLSHADLSAANDFGLEKVTPVRRELGAASAARQVFPKASLTLLSVPL